jgi:hypothetical protein
VTRNVRTYDHFCLVARALESVGDRLNEWGYGTSGAGPRPASRCGSDAGLDLTGDTEPVQRFRRLISTMAAFVVPAQNGPD